MITISHHATGKGFKHTETVEAILNPSDVFTRPVFRIWNWNVSAQHSHELKRKLSEKCKNWSVSLARHTEYIYNHRQATSEISIIH